MMSAQMSNLDRLEGMQKGRGQYLQPWKLFEMSRSDLQLLFFFFFFFGSHFYFSPYLYTKYKYGVEHDLNRKI